MEVLRGNTYLWRRSGIVKAASSVNNKYAEKRKGDLK